jgi:hypothetical protein
MLAVAFANWISLLPERAFDAPFLGLLRANGFYDIHFTHGAYEFGKDFIAKRDEPQPTQYAFQSKAGDIGGAEWMSMLGQLEELLGTVLVHPGYEAKLPKKFVLVTTGQLIGKATIGPADFKARLRETGRGEFEVWDVHVLSELLAGSPRFPAAPSPELVVALGAVESGPLGERELEKLLAAMVPPESAALSLARRAFVDNSLIVSRLAEKGWPFLALGAALNGVRIGAVHAHSRPNEGKELLRDALEHYVLLGEHLLAPLLRRPDEPIAWIEWIGGHPPRMIAYSVACVKTVEYLGLAALHREHQGQVEEAKRLAALCASVVNGQRGSVHPISDRFAASYSPAIAAVFRFGHRDAAERLVREVTKWLCDRYEGEGFGLASTYSTPQEEVRMLLGAPFESVHLEKRSDSLLAVALADAAYVFLPQLFPAVVNDLTAVGIHPGSLHAKDEATAYFMTGKGTQPLINIGYPAEWRPSALPHHALQSSPRVPENIGGPAVPLALGAVLRDRLFTDVLPRLAPRIADASS